MVLVSASTPVTQPAPAPAPRFGFAGMMIGAGMADLRAVRPKAVCAPEKDGYTDCTAPDQLIGGYLARDLTYRFIGGKLVQIRFHSSVDGFAFVVARLKHDFGEPADIRRDEVKLDDPERRGLDLPHVMFTWRNGRSTIRLSDPATPGQLAVSMTLNAARIPDPGPT